MEGSLYVFQRIHIETYINFIDTNLYVYMILYFSVFLPTLHLCVFSFRASDGVDSAPFCSSADDPKIGTYRRPKETLCQIEDQNVLTHVCYSISWYPVDL